MLTFANPILRGALTHGVMVALLILVQSVKVRILMGQQNGIDSNTVLFWSHAQKRYFAAPLIIFETEY